MAKKIIFNGGPFWGYTQYIDIYKAAWEINHVSRDAKQFRIINIQAHFDPCKNDGTWGNLDPDSIMFDAIKREVIDKEQKALIYSGSHHAFTRYHQPVYDFDTDSLKEYFNKRMGNLVYNLVGEKAFNIYLHAPWTADDGWDKDKVLPVNGVIDSLMQILENRPIGFDVANTPLGKLKSNNSYYSLGHPDFTLSRYCDGYIFQKAIKDYEFVDLEPNFYDEESLAILKKYAICYGWDSSYQTATVEFANAAELGKENIKSHFRGLME